MAVNASCDATTGSASSAEEMMSAFRVARSAAGSAPGVGDGVEEHAATARMNVAASVDRMILMIVLE